MHFCTWASWKPQNPTIRYFSSNAKRRNSYPGIGRREVKPHKGQAGCIRTPYRYTKLHLRNTEEDACLLKSNISNREQGQRKRGELTYLERCKVTIRVLRRHPHGLIMGWRRSRPIWGSSRTRVVLGTSPGETNSGVANRITLHLVDGHFSGMALDKLDEAAALSRWDLNIGDLAKALEEGSKFILGDIAGKTTNKDRCVIWVGKLVHWLWCSVVTQRWCTHGIHTAGHTSTHGSRHSGHSRWCIAARLVLGGGSRNAHRPVTAIDALHLGESTLLVTLLRETDKAIATGHAGDGICHDLCRLAGRESGLEERNKNIFINLRSEIANEN